MALEAIPLSSELNDEHKQTLGLTDEQFERFRDFMASKQSELEGQVLYMSQSEIQELRSILEESTPPNTTDSLNTFVNAQIEEGLASSDIMESDPEKLDTLDKHAQDILFGSNGPFELYEIDPKAQDIMSVGFVASIIQRLNSDDIDTDVITQIFNGDINAIKSLLGDFFENFPDKNEVTIENNGLNNEVFMNPSKSQEFFSELFTGTADTEDIVARIEAGSTSGEIPYTDLDMSDFYTAMQTGAENIKKLLEEAGIETVPTPGVTTPEGAGEEKSAWEKFFDFIAKLLKNIGSALSGLGAGLFRSTKEETPTPEIQTETDSPSEDIAISSLFEAIIAQNPEQTDMLTGLTQELEGDPSLSQQFQSILEELHPEQSYSDTFIELYQGESILNSTVSIFGEHGFYDIFQEGTSNGNIQLNCLKEYQRYTIYLEENNKSDNDDTRREYSLLRQSENWEVNS